MKDDKDNKKEFRCMNCGRVSTEDMAGEEPEHCPNCLAGIHREDEQGYECGGILEPVGVWVRKNGEWAVIHRCTRCGKVASNRVAADDNPMKLMGLAMRPFGSRMIARADIKELTRSMEGA